MSLKYSVRTYKFMNKLQSNTHYKSSSFPPVVSLKGFHNVQLRQLDIIINDVFYYVKWPIMYSDNTYQITVIKSNIQNYYGNYNVFCSRLGYVRNILCHDLKRLIASYLISDKIQYSIIIRTKANVILIDIKHDDKVYEFLYDTLYNDMRHVIDTEDNYRELRPILHKDVINESDPIHDILIIIDDVIRRLT